MEAFPKNESSKVDEGFDALRNRHRRQLLIALLIHDAENRGVDPSNVISVDAERDVLETHLFHNHLPKLESMEFVEWDRERNVVRKGPEWCSIEPVLRLMHAHRDELPAEWV